MSRSHCGNEIPAQKNRYRDQRTRRQDSRIIAPLVVQESCLSCHAEHGYSLGDIRGALSITVPLARADRVIHKNNATIFKYAFFSVLAVALALTFLFNKLVARGIDRLSQAMEQYPEQGDDVSDDKHRYKDEIGRLIKGFGALSISCANS